MKLFLKQFAEGLATQRGALFGFGPNSDKDTVPIHNLGEERSVGFINHELGL